MSVPLSRPYTSRLGAPTVDRVDPLIFTLTYFGACMDCTFCRDACCQYGADVEIPLVAELDRHREELEAYMGVPRAGWFREDPDDFGVLPEPEYPGGEYTRTQVVELPAGRSPHTDEACVFLDPAERGCRLHRFALERGIPVHRIKPMVCVLFPLSFASGELTPAYEFDEVDGDLVCRGPGATIYRSTRSEVEYYFGPNLVAELDRLERSYRPAEAEKGIPLPICSP